MQCSDESFFPFITVFPAKPLTPEKISGMFIVSLPIRCELKPHKVVSDSVCSMNCFSVLNISFRSIVC